MRWRTGQRVTGNLDHRHARRSRQVHRASVVANEEMAAFQEGARLAEGRLTYDVDHRTANLLLEFLA